MDAKTILSIGKKPFFLSSKDFFLNILQMIWLLSLWVKTVLPSKEEHIAWCVSDESPRIGGFKVIFEENGVAVGTHTAFNPQGLKEEMSCIIHKFENNKVTEWKALVSVHNEELGS